MKFNTKAVHTGFPSDDPHQASAVPIYQSVAFGYDEAQDLSDVFAGRKPGYSYSRSANPTLTAVEQRITALENGLGAVAVNSGLGAIHATFHTLLQAGDHMVCSRALFGGTFRLLENNIVPFGIDIGFVDITDLESVKASITEKTKLIFCETLGNPKLDVPDIKALAEIANAHGIPLVLDATMTPPNMVQTKDLGAHIVAYSTTKFMSVSATGVGGVVVDLGTYDWKRSPSPAVAAMYSKVGPMAFLAHTRKYSAGAMGLTMQPFSAFLVMEGLETLSLRVERQSANAMAVAQYLEAHPKVASVHYPGLSSSPYHDTAAKQFGQQFGSLLTVTLQSKAQCYAFIERLQLFKNMANFGDTKSVIIHPYSTIFNNLDEETIANAGVTEALCRLSIGIEDQDDLIADLAQALSEV